MNIFRRLWCRAFHSLSHRQIPLTTYGARFFECSKCGHHWKLPRAIGKY